MVAEKKKRTKELPQKHAQRGSMEGVDEDKGGMDQEVVRHVGKIFWSQMAILQRGSESDW